MRKFVDMSFRDISALGSIAFLGVLFFVSLIFGRYNLALQLVIGQAVVYIISIPAKTLYKKKRPAVRNYKNKIEEIDASSFPSIHAGRIGMLGVLGHFFAGNVLFSFLLLIVVVLVAYSRIHVKDHDWKDVLAGLAVGVVAGVAGVWLV